MSFKKEIGVGAVALALLALFALFATPNAQAQSREELDKWAQKLVDIRNNECKNEHKKKVRGKIEYAAILLTHSEVEEAIMNIEKAISKAKSAACAKALEKNNSLSSVN